MAKQIDDDLKPWERQHRERPEPFQAFVLYRDQAGRRSAHNVAVQLTKSDTLMRRWSAQWNWVERAAAYDAHLDRQAREKIAKTLLETRERHARVCQGSLTVLTLPTRALLESLSDPATLQQMVAKARSGTPGFLEVLALAARCSQVIPALITAERLALGLSADVVESEGKPDFSISDLIVRDPVAVDLAIQLLDRVAGTAPATVAFEPAQEWKAVAGAVRS